MHDRFDFLRAPARRGRIARWAPLLLGAALALPGAAPVQAPPQDDGIDDTRALLEKWVETRRLISQETRDWALGKELLNDRIALVQREIEALRARIGDAEASIGEADSKAAELRAEQQRLQQASAVLEESIGTLEGRSRALLTRLPEPIRERVRPLSQRLPSGEQEAGISLGQRFQNVVGILEEVDKFNREITTNAEVRTLSNGATAQVTALYVGIGAGFYVSQDGRHAGVGRPGDDGWVWQEKDAAAADIARAVAILRNEKAADFVPLPVQVQ